MAQMLRKLDFYRRIPADMTESSIHGSVISIAALLFSVYLFLSNLNEYFTVQRKSEMLIDAEKNKKLKINLDVVFPRVPCNLLAMDVSDVMGSHEIETKGELYKISLKADGITELKREKFKDTSADDSSSSSYTGFHGLSRHNWILEHQGGNQERLKEHIMNNEGCRLVGSLEVNKVPGNIHISTHSANFMFSSFSLADFTRGDDLTTSSESKERRSSDELFKRKKNLDISHEFRHLSFGQDSDILHVSDNFKNTGILRPMDGLKQEVLWKEYKPFSFPGSFRSDSFFQRFPGSISDDSDKDTTRKVDKDKNEGDKEASSLVQKKVAAKKNGLYSSDEKREMEQTDGKDATALKLIPQPTIFEYFCHVVPTTYKGVTEDPRHVYQYTVNSNRIQNTNMPSIYIRYHLSPVTVKYTDYRMAFFNFFIQTLAIVGGLFTVAGIIESLMYRSIKHIQKKFELGKLT